MAVIGLAVLAALGWFLFDRAPDPPAEREVDAAPPERAPVGVPPSLTASPARVTVDGAMGAMIEGTVRDLVTRAAVAGVDVTARVDGGADIDHVATADGAGRYRLALGPGRYRLGVAGAGVTTIESPWVVVAAGARAQQIDLAVVTLATVSGRVVDGAGAPIGGAVIHHDARVGERTVAASDALLATTRSGADGGFTLAVVPGTVTLTAVVDGLPAASTLLRWIEPAATVTGIEIVVDQPGALRGHIVDEAGRPVEGALITAQRRALAADDPTSPSTSVVAGTASVVDGSYRLPGLPAEPLRVLVRKAGHAPAIVLATPSAGDERVVEIVLPAARTIAGRVVDAAGVGIAGATVTATPRQGALPSSEPATTGADGAFTIGDLAGGVLDLAAVGPATPAGAPARGDRIAVMAPATGVVVTLHPTGAIAGVVTASAGQRRITEFAVRLVDVVPLGGGARSFLDEPRALVSSIDGSYRLDDLLAGTYTLEVGAPGFGTVELTGVSVPPGEIGDGSATLLEGATVGGTVTDAASGAPITGALVTTQTGSAALAFTDERGAFALADVAPGRRGVVVSRPGYIGKIESVVADAGARTSVTIALARTASDAAAIELAGIGASVSLTEQGLIIGEVMPHTAAELAGLRGGDRLISIDGMEPHDKTLGQCIEALRGVVGTVVRLGVDRAGEVFYRDVVRRTVRFTPPE